MGTVLGFISKKQQNVCERFLSCVAPNQTYRIDHVHKHDCNLVSRVVITSSNGKYLVNHYQARLDSNGLPKPMSLETVFRFDCHAMEKLEQITTCLEIENWEFLQDERFIIYDVTHDLGAMESWQLDFQNTFDFKFHHWEQDVIMTRPLPNGIHAICTLDPYGLIKISTVRGNRHIELNDSAMFNMLKSIDGARGFVAEGIFDGIMFWVTDVHYLHDKWIRDMPFIEREKYVSAYLAKHNIALPRLGMTAVRRMALDTMIGQVVKGLIAYTADNRRCALSIDRPELYWFEAEYPQGYRPTTLQNKEIGFVKGFGRLSIEHTKLYLLSHSPSNLGTCMLLI